MILVVGATGHLGIEVCEHLSPLIGFDYPNRRAHGGVVDTANMSARLPFERSTVRQYVEALRSS